MSELEKAKSILRALIEADARGQGLPWREAMEAANNFLREPINTTHFFMHEDKGGISCISCGVKYSNEISVEPCPGKGKLAEYETTTSKDHDPVNHPKHYTSHPSGVECIDITRHMPFNIGNAIKYLWRAGQKEREDAVTALEKARFYIEDQIKLIRGEHKRYK